MNRYRSRGTAGYRLVKIVRRRSDIAFMISGSMRPSWGQAEPLAS